MAKHQRKSHVGVNFNNTVSLEQKLIREITSLERQLENLKLTQTTVDFSMMQTYKEMIQCRRKMLKKIPRTP